jgi:hypothetical protein
VALVRRHDPLVRLAGHPGDPLEVAVVVQDGGLMLLGGGGDEKVDQADGTMVATPGQVSAVVQAPR